MSAATTATARAARRRYNRLSFPNGARRRRRYVSTDFGYDDIDSRIVFPPFARPLLDAALSRARRGTSAIAAFRAPQGTSPCCPSFAHTYVARQIADGAAKLDETEHCTSQGFQMTSHP